MQTTAPSDGFVVTMPADNKRRFMSEINFAATFNDKAAASLSGNQRLYRAKTPADTTLYRVAILTEAVTFDFKEGPYAAKAGDALVENADDIDGYTLLTADQFHAEMQPAGKPAATNKAAPRHK